MKRLMWVMWMTTVAVAVAMLMASVAEAGVRVEVRPGHTRVWWELGSKDVVAADGIHPLPTHINGVPFFPFPGDGGQWVKYRSRACYVYEGLLYVQVKPDNVALRFRRVMLPKELGGAAVVAPVSRVSR